MPGSSRQGAVPLGGQILLLFLYIFLVKPLKLTTGRALLHATAGPDQVGSWKFVGRQSVPVRGEEAGWI